MSRVEVTDKARDLIAPVIGRDKTERLIETALALDTVADLRVLQPLLRRG